MDKPIPEAVRDLLPEAWLPDCQGKQDFDSDLVALSCRYYPPNYDSQGRHSVSASIIFGEGQDTVAQHNFHADTEAGAKGKAEQWAAERVASIVSTLTAAQQQGQAVACERCAGSGTVTATDTTRGPDGHDFDADCPHCDGTGDVHRPDGEWRGRCNCAQPMQQGGGEVIQRHVVTRYRDGSVHVADTAAPPSAPVGALDQLRAADEDGTLDTAFAAIRANPAYTQDGLAQQPAAVDEARVVETIRKALHHSYGAGHTDYVNFTEALDFLATQHQEPTT